MKRAILFVDANNWYHNTKKIFNPGNIDIIKIANLLCKIKGFSLSEIRWYASIPNIADGEKMYYKHMSFLEKIEKNGIKVITRKLQRLSNKEAIKNKNKLIKNIGLCSSCRRLIESAFFMPEIQKKEKGIDVWLAIDMIKFCLIDKSNDACILISGDADFVPALTLIKENKRDILVASAPYGFSKELRDKFEYFILRKETLKKCFRS